MEPGFGSRKVDLSEYSSGSSLGEKITGAFADRPENTLAGSVLGMAHDLISSPNSQQEKAERAAKHDMAAHFVADTVAIVPQLKVTTAGLTRAALLVDPHKGLQGNALNFGKNFAEGAALNGVGRLAGASGQRLTQAYLGRGLLAESATHLSVGFGFGAVKSGFDEKSWHNSKGEFSVGSGAAAILKGGTIGAAFNLPAGYIGLRAAKGTVSLLGENASMRTSNVVAGTVSGYAGGAVFGGIESVMHGKSLSETMENIHMAGTAGALTGGFISGSDHTKNTQGIFKYISSEPVSRPLTPELSSGAKGMAIESGTRGLASGKGIASSLELTPGTTNRSLTREISFASIEAENAALGARSDTHRRARYERPERKMLERITDRDGVEQDTEIATAGKKAGHDKNETGPHDKKAEPISFKGKDPSELSEVLDYEAPLVPQAKDFAGRLRSPRTETVKELHLDPEYKGEIKEYADFAKHSVLKEHQMRVWDIEGHTAVLKVEESYAQRQDAVMKDIAQLRTKAEQTIAFDVLTSKERMEIGEQWDASRDRVELLSKYMSREDARKSLPVIEAREKISTGEYQKVILPHEFIALLDGLPDGSLVKSLTIFNEHDPLNPYLAVKYESPNFKSAASADPKGNITFFLPPEKMLARTYLREHMNHEWTHLLDFNSPLEHDLFALASLVDREVPKEGNLTDMFAKSTNDGAGTPAESAKPATESAKPGSGTENSKPGTAIVINDKPGTAGFVVNGKPGSGAGMEQVEGVFSTDKPDAGATRFGVDPDRQKDGKFYISDYSQKNRYENWAVHLGDEMMAPSVDGLVYLGQEMPVRTAILMRALSKGIEQSTPKAAGIYNPTFARRVAYSNDVIVPQAVEILVNRIKAGTPAEKAAAAELLGYLGNKETHTSLLRKLAIDSESGVLPEGVPEATHRPYKRLGGPDAPKEGTPKERRTISDIAFDSALRLRERNPEEQIDFLIEQGKPGSPTQDMALARLEDLPSERGWAYVRFLRLAGDPKNTPELIRMMADMPDKKGAEMVFEEALRLGEGGEGFEGYKKSLIVKALEIPHLRGRATDMVRPYLDSSMLSTLGRLSRQQWDKDVASKAQKLLDTVRLDSTIDTATMLMKSSLPDNVEAGIQQASKIHDHRLIEPLLTVYLKGPESTRVSAAVALHQYQPQMIRFYLRTMNAHGVNADPNLINKLYLGVRVPFRVQEVTDKTHG